MPWSFERTISFSHRKKIIPRCFAMVPSIFFITTVFTNALALPVHIRLGWFLVDHIVEHPLSC